MVDILWLGLWLFLLFVLLLLIICCWGVCFLRFVCLVDFGVLDLLFVICWMWSLFGCLVYRSFCCFDYVKIVFLWVYCVFKWFCLLFIMNLVICFKIVWLGVCVLLICFVCFGFVVLVGLVFGGELGVGIRQNLGWFWF